MAEIDVSLDDYIKTKNIYHGPAGVTTSKFGNRNNQNGQNWFGKQNKAGFQRGQPQQFLRGGMTQRRPQRGRVQGLGPGQRQHFMGSQKQGFMSSQKQGFVGGQKQGFVGGQKQNFTGGQKQGFAGGQTPGFFNGPKPGFAGGQKQPGLVKKLTKPGLVTLQGVRVGNNPMSDARDKLVLKTKGSLVDARQKIITSQVKKGMFDARSKLSRKPPRQSLPSQGQSAQTGALLPPPTPPQAVWRPPPTPPQAVWNPPPMPSQAAWNPPPRPTPSQAAWNPPPRPTPSQAVWSQPPQLMSLKTAPGIGGPLQLTRKINNSDSGMVSSISPGGMNLSRTLTNTAVPAPRGTHIEVGTGGNIKITKTLPDTTVSFDGSSLTVTKRASAIQGVSPLKVNVQKTVANPIRVSAASSIRGPVSNPVRGPVSNPIRGPEANPVRNPVAHPARGPVMQVQNDQFVQHRHGYTTLSARVAEAPKPPSRPPLSSAAALRSRSASSSLAGRAKATAATPRMHASGTALAPSAPVGIKRKHPESCGPLRFTKSSEEPGKPSPPKKTRAAPPLRLATDRMAMTSDMFADLDKRVLQVEEEDRDDDVLSPLQGYRILVSNLHSVVNQDDIIELFGAIGALKKARLIRQGTAEVVYVNRDDAMKAVHKYHNRELDGQPMLVKMMTPLTATIKQAEEESAPPSLPEPLRLAKPSQSKSSAPYSVEIPVIHKALFKIGSNEPSKPVTFTVKI